MMQTPAKYLISAFCKPQIQCYLKYVEVILSKFNLPQLLVENLGQQKMCFSLSQLSPVELR